jgi:hypothetical protein
MCPQEISPIHNLPRLSPLATIELEGPTPESNKANSAQSGISVRLVIAIGKEGAQEE